MDKIDIARISSVQADKALELQVLIANFAPHYINKPIHFSSQSWDIGSNEDCRLIKIRHLAKSKGYVEKDFLARNEIVSRKNNLVKPISHLQNSLIATYVTSSNYYNTFVRRKLNPLQNMFKEPLTTSMGQLVEKFRNQSEKAAYDWGYSIESTCESMKLQGRLSIAFSIMLLKNLLMERKKPYKSYRGILASAQHIALLNYFSENKKIVKVDQFLSTTTKSSIACGFSKGQYDSIPPNSGDQKAIFIVEGTSGAEISAWLDEGEVLYPPETCFQISQASYAESAWYIGINVYRLKEVSKSLQKNLDKIPFLIDVAKLQRQLHK